MRFEWFSLCVLAGVALLLYCTNEGLIQSLRDLQAAVAAREHHVQQEVQQLRNERIQLAGERSQIAAHLGRMKVLVGSLTLATASATAGDEKEAKPVEEDRESIVARDTLSFPLMSEDEWRHVRDRQHAIPVPRPSDQLLYHATSAEDLINDLKWNPTARALSDSEITQLEELIDDYRYFRRRAKLERLDRLMVPEMERMKEVGAFVEYPIGAEAPPLPVIKLNGRTVMSLASRSDQEGYRRMYYFYPDEYPGLYHRRQVERERSVERYVEIYELLNPEM